MASSDKVFFAQELVSGMPGKGVIKTTEIDTAYDHKTNNVVDRKLTQEELNAMFNQGKNAQGQDIGGSSYTEGTGITIDENNHINLKPATNLQIGGIKLGTHTSAQGVTYVDYIVVGSTTGNEARVIIPEATETLAGLITKGFVNSSIATATATFRGTYNLVSDLNLTTAATSSNIAAALATAMSSADPVIEPDNNDYCFVMVPTADATPTQIAHVDRYKYSNSAWTYEYTLNNSGFTAVQWAAIQSGITSERVSKLDALPNYAGLSALLGAKLDKVVVTTASEASTTAESAHAKGEYFFMGGTLYRATAAIAVGDTIETDSTAQGYNAAATTIAGEIGNIATALDAILS